MKKNGFTLVELLGVIVILGILITIAMTNVTGLMQESKSGINEIAAKNLSDAAVTFVKQGNIKLTRCTVGMNVIDKDNFDPATLPACVKSIKVSTLKNQGTFSDNSGSCGDDKNIYVYRYTYQNAAGTEILDEVKTYIPDDTCMNK